MLIELPRILKAWSRVDWSSMQRVDCKWGRGTTLKPLKRKYNNPGNETEPEQNTSERARAEIVI